MRHFKSLGKVDAQTESGQVEMTKMIFACPKGTKMGLIIGYRIEYNETGDYEGQPAYSQQNPPSSPGAGYCFTVAFTEPIGERF